MLVHYENPGNLVGECDIYTASLRSWLDCLREVRSEEPRREPAKANTPFPTSFSLHFCHVESFKLWQLEAASIVHTNSCMSM